MSASDGTAISSISYFPFGLTRTGSVNTTKEFTGQRLDSTGLYYYNARYYDPQIGRFICPDTVGIDFTNPQTLNRYSYCVNNPLNHRDPSGHSFSSFIKGCVNFAAAHPVIAALAVVLVVSAIILAAPVVLSAISTAACVAWATTIAATSATAAAAILPTATAIASIPVFGAVATTVANIGLGVFGFGCAFPESSSPSGSGMAVETNPRTGTPLEGVTDHSTLALKNDAYHNLPSCYDGLSRFGNIEYNVIDSAGRSSTQIKLDWCYDEKWGQLQWYYNDNDELFHRFFEPDK